VLRHVLAIGTLLAATIAATADDVDLKKIAKAQAEELQTAIVKGDYAKVAEMSHPKAVKGLGGKEKMVAMMTTKMKAMRDEGYDFKSVAVGEPSDPIASGSSLYLTVPFKMELKVPGGRLTTHGALVGTSGDSGKSWIFIDTTPGREAITKVLPDLPLNLVFPKAKPPVFEKD
jgi:hypothetical protein